MGNRKKDWERLTKKYDPKGEYQKRFDELQKAGKIKLTMAAWYGIQLWFSKDWSIDT